MKDRSIMKCRWIQERNSLTFLIIRSYLVHTICMLHTIYAYENVKRNWRYVGFWKSIRVKMALSIWKQIKEMKICCLSKASEIKMAVSIWKTKSNFEPNLYLLSQISGSPRISFFIFTNDTNLIACTECPRIPNNSCKPLKLPVTGTPTRKEWNNSNSKSRLQWTYNSFCVLSVFKDTLSFSKPGIIYMCTKHVL